MEITATTSANLSEMASTSISYFGSAFPLLLWILGMFLGFILLSGIYKIIIKAVKTAFK